LLFGCAASERSAPSTSKAAILLFDGTGASENDVRALQSLLTNKKLPFVSVDSEELARMSASQLGKYRLIIFPGGNFVTMANELSSQTMANIRNAVHNGVPYLGICAGGFLAGRVRDKGLNFASGTKFAFYSAEASGVRKAAVAISAANEPTLDQYWEDGPQFTGWGTVVAKYPDGTAAAVEGRFGGGRVILLGVHPEAPESWRSGLAFRTPVKTDNDYAAGIIRSAVNGRPIAHY
jgi:glutamine amidotransferase-like uncharacterized protein